MICVDKEVDTLLENNIEARSDKTSGYNRYRPGNRWLSRPAEPKEADSEENATDCHRGKTCFGDRFSVCRGGNACITRLVGEVNDDGGEDADKEGDKWEG